MLEYLIKIDSGQYLSDILSLIPNNVILNKTLTGCGATTLEIDAPRNSIIIEPNVPVIIGKKQQHPFLMPVYEGTTKDDLKEYLAGEQDGYRKIITTPEGFDKKVIPAMYETSTPVYDDYFLLFDECEKTIQDVGYRGDIYLPVEDFFKFRNKAMVSATPIIPSDPRFEEQGFEMLKIVPSYEYRQPLTLCITNNTVAVLRKLLERLKDETVCIFLNSTDTALSLIQTFRLQGRSKIFCSEKSVKKLKRLNFPHASDSLGEMAEVNIFTSRFYSAVDIYLDRKPHVIVLSDVIRAPYSIIDPHTEIIQAIGRFRNGIAKAYHIANTSDRLQCLSREELEYRLENEESVYMAVAAMQTTNEIQTECKQQALKGMDYKRFVTREGKRNHFMWDNAWEDEKIKSYYSLPSALQEVYKTAPFRLDVHRLEYPITDEDRLQREKAGLNSKELWQEVIRQLSALKAKNCNPEAAFLIDELGDEFNIMTQAFVILGEKRIEELSYNRRNIESALKQMEENRLLTSAKMQKAVYARFHTGDIVETAEVNAFMKRLITENGIPFNGQVDKKVIRLFFEIEDCKLRGNRGLRFGNKRYEF